MREGWKVYDQFDVFKSYRSHLEQGMFSTEQMHSDVEKLKSCRQKSVGTAMKSDLFLYFPINEIAKDIQFERHVNFKAAYPPATMQMTDQTVE